MTESEDSDDFQNLLKKANQA
jgi:hypothetical protein